MGWSERAWNSERSFVILSVSEGSRRPACEILR
jgi:hypothetical protein